MSSLRLLRSEKNAVASLASWLQTNVLQAGEQFFTGNYEQAEGPFPVLAMTQRPMPELLTGFFDDYLGKSLNGTMQWGTIHQFLIEFNLIVAENDTVRNARQYVGLMRERLWDALWYAGQLDENNAVIVPNIQLLDFDTVPSNPTATGSYIWWPSEETNTWMESPLYVDEADPMKKRMQVMVRFRWISFRQPGE